MDWLERMNGAMNYIETNLADNISYDEIAQIAGSVRTSVQESPWDHADICA